MRVGSAIDVATRTDSSSASAYSGLCAPAARRRASAVANRRSASDGRLSRRASVVIAIAVVTDSLPDIGGVVASLSEDAPVPFDVTLLAEHLDHLAAEQGGNFAAFVSTLGLRIRSMLADQRLGSVIGKTPPTSFEEWLKSYVGDDGASNGPLAVIDLSLVPSEVVHVVVAVLARVIFESLQRYRRQSKR